MNVLCAPVASMARRTQPPQGLSAIPESWVPAGDTRGIVTSPYGGDYCSTNRSPSRVFIDCDTFLSPDIELTDLGGGRIEISVDMPFPLPNIESRGRAEFRNNTVYYAEENGSRTGEIHRRYSGTLDFVLHEPGQEDMAFSYTPLSAQSHNDGLVL